jgi:AraC-like DNA-binding protein
LPDERVERFRRADHFHGSFPLAASRVHSHAECRVHRHEFSELVIVLRGRGLHIAPGASWPIGAGDAFVLHGDQEHGYVDTADLDLVNIMFVPEELPIPSADIATLPGYHILFTLEPLYRRRDRFESRLRLTQEQLRDVAVLVERLEREVTQRPPGWQYSAIAAFMLIVADLSRHYAEVDTPSALPLQRLGKVISYVERHYAETPGLADLATVGCMSRRTLSREFRAALGVTPVQYMVRLRIQRAMELLTASDAGISEIAASLGYGDANYFTRQFRAVTGMTPREVRRSQHPQIRSVTST